MKDRPRMKDLPRMKDRPRVKDRPRKKDRDVAEGLTWYRGRILVDGSRFPPSGFWWRLVGSPLRVRSDRDDAKGAEAEAG